MSRWLTGKSWDTTLVLAVLAMDDWGVVPDWMLTCIPSGSINPCEISWAEAAIALTSLCGDLHLKDLLRPFLLMWLFKNIKLILNQVLPF